MARSGEIKRTDDTTRKLARHIYKTALAHGNAGLDNESAMAALHQGLDHIGIPKGDFRARYLTGVKK